MIGVIAAEFSPPRPDLGYNPSCSPHGGEDRDRARRHRPVCGIGLALYGLVALGGGVAALYGGEDCRSGGVI